MIVHQKPFLWVGIKMHQIRSQILATLPFFCFYVQACITSNLNHSFLKHIVSKVKIDEFFLLRSNIIVALFIAYCGIVLVFVGIVYSCLKLLRKVRQLRIGRCYFQVQVSAYLSFLVECVD